MEAVHDKPAEIPVSPANEESIMSTSIRSGGVAAAVAMALAALTPQSLGAATWKASIWGPSRSSTLPFESYAKEVAAKTGGQVKIEFTYDRNKPTDAADLLKSGARDAAYICSSHVGEKMPLMTVLDLPMFTPDSIPALAKVELALADHPVIQSELKTWNARMMIPVPLPQYQLMSTRPIAKVADFKGAKVSVPPEMGKMLEEYGASTQPMSGPETLSALKSGAIDIVALPYPFGFAELKIHEGAKYVTEKISLGTHLCYFAVSQKSFEALPAKVQETMLSLRQPAVAQYETIYAREGAGNIEAFKQKGLQFVTFSPADRARLVAKAIKQWQGWVEDREKQGLQGKEVFEFAQSKIRESIRN
jgi:TRAP-type C4-dicarboxylate transport system substrate-binding protein